MILSQFEEAVWHGRGSDCDIAKAWHHGGEIVSAVEAVLEFGEVAGYMLVADGAVSARDGALDVAEGGVDPLEGRVQGGLTTRSRDDRLVDAAGGADPSEAVQAVTDNDTGGMEIALRQGRDFGPAETLIWTAPASQGLCCSWRRVWSIAVMCPASMCGRVDRGPRGVTRIGPQTSRRGASPKGFPGVFRSSVRPIAILLLSLQAPGQNGVSELRPEAAGDKPHRLPSWPRASEPSCWPARLL